MIREILGSISSAVIAIAVAVAVYLRIQTHRRQKELAMKGKLHDVYWGTHGCKRVKGHAIPCMCECKTTLPTGHQYVFGNDKDTAVFDPKHHVEKD